MCDCVSDWGIRRNRGAGGTSFPCTSLISRATRTPLQVSLMKVPSDALLGHAFHTYQLVSPDGSVTFEFQHNVVGRTTYAEGTVDACLFLSKQVCGSFQA